MSSQHALYSVLYAASIEKFIFIIIWINFKSFFFVIKLFSILLCAKCGNATNFCFVQFIHTCYNRRVLWREFIILQT